VQFIGRLCNKPPSVAIDSIFEYNDNNNQDGDEIMVTTTTMIMVIMQLPDIN
jgi:hypothetical protein